MPTVRHAALAAAVASALLGTTQVAGQVPGNGTALTIYSTARPGAISPERLPPAGGAARPFRATPWCARSATSTSRRGRNTVRFTDVAALIDPTTVAFESLTDPQGHQRPRAELPVRPRQHRQAAAEVHRPTDHRRPGPRQGQWNPSPARCSRPPAAWSCGATDGTVQILPHNAGVKLPELPGGLITRPTLVWDIDDAARRHAPHPRVVPDQRHHLVGGLQRDLRRGQATPTRASSTSAPG